MWNFLKINIIIAKCRATHHCSIVSDVQLDSFYAAKMFFLLMTDFDGTRIYCGII